MTLGRRLCKLYPILIQFLAREDNISQLVPDAFYLSNIADQPFPGLFSQRTAVVSRTEEDDIVVSHGIVDTEVVVGMQTQVVSISSGKTALAGAMLVHQVTGL